MKEQKEEQSATNAIREELKELTTYAILLTHYATMLEGAAKNLNSILNNLESFAKKQDISKERVDFRKVRQLIESITEKATQSIISRFSQIKQTAKRVEKNSNVHSK